VDPPPSLAFAVRAPLERADLPGLRERVCALLERSGAASALCDVTGVAADAVAADALARLALAARRHRCEIRLVGVSPELRELLEFLGLRAVLPEAQGARLRCEPRR
jgi:anti-anti-sigma regulatory factor